MKKNTSLIISITAVVLAAAAIIITILVNHLSQPSEIPTSTTAPTTEPTTAPPLILLSSVKHDFVEKEVVGQVVSEDLGIDCKLVFGTTDDCLRLGAGIHKTSSLPGFATPPMVAGHVQTVFRGFKNAEVGKTISIEMPYGTYVYKISKIEVIEKDDFSFDILKVPSKQAIFYTCYPFEKVSYVKTKRMFLYCDIVSGTRLFDDVHYDLPDEFKDQVIQPGN